MTPSKILLEESAQSLVILPMFHSITTNFSCAEFIEFCGLAPILGLAQNWGWLAPFWGWSVKLWRHNINVTSNIHESDCERESKHLV